MKKRTNSETIKTKQNTNNNTPLKSNKISVNERMTSALNRSLGKSHQKKQDNSLNSSAIKNQITSLYEANNESGNEKFLSFEEFRDNIGNIIAQYKLDSSENKGKKLNLESLNLIEKIKIKETLQAITKFKNESSQAEIRVVVDEKEYQNPYDSALILRKNQEINGQIKLGSYERTRQIYDKEIKKINDITYNQEHMPKKIKITNLMLKGGPDPATDQLSPKKKKEPMIQLPSIIPIGKNRYSELYGSYKSCTKNFPESREQFTLSYDLCYVILFGGLAANKTNMAWTLDPGKYILKLTLKFNIKNSND